MTEAVLKTEKQRPHDLERQILIESLTFLYRSMPSAALGHTVAGSFVVFALYDVINPIGLFVWLACLLFVAGVRLALTTFVERRLLDAETSAIKDWAKLLLMTTFVQTAVWGATTIFLWPEGTEHRALLVVILAGVIAAGGIMLALHRRSFLIYCLPIAIPTVIQLVISGSRLEYILAILVAFYSILLLFSVNRLTDVFLDGLRLRYLMQNESRTDALTTLSNRRGFDEALHDIWQNSIRTNQSVGLLIIDVDFFKNYNDFYGHQQGDVALKKLGELLSRVASRSTDVCSRIGGEEFAVIMPATELEGTKQVAQAIQEELNKARIPHRNSDRGFLTVSIGLNVAMPGRGDLADHFVMETDMALYEAKEAGRNRVFIAKSIKEDNQQG